MSTIVEFVVITEDPIDAVSSDDNHFTNIGADKLVKTISFEIHDDYTVDIKQVQNKLVNYDILEGLDRSIGACLIKTKTSKPGLYHEAWADASVEHISKFLEALSETISRGDENDVVKAIRKKYRDKQLNKLV